MYSITALLQDSFYVCVRVRVCVRKCVFVYFRIFLATHARAKQLKYYFSSTTQQRIVYLSYIIALDASNIQQQASTTIYTSQFDVDNAAYMSKFLHKNESTHVTYNKRRISMSYDVKNICIRFSIRKSISEHILYIAIECVALTLFVAESNV